MRERNLDFHIRLNDIEYDKLEEMSLKSKMTKSDVIRNLILEKEIKEKPGYEFYEVMKELSKIGVNLNQIAYRANKTNSIDKSYYKELADEWLEFSRQVKSKFL